MSEDSLKEIGIKHLQALVTQPSPTSETLGLVKEMLKQSNLRSHIQSDPELCFNILRYLIAQDNPEHLNEVKFLFKNFSDLMDIVLKCQDQALVYKLMRTAAFSEAMSKNRLKVAAALYKKKKTIAITLPKPPQGYGDMLFALKLAYQLREKLYKEYGYTGEVLFITDAETAATIRELNGHQEFSLDVMSIAEIEKKRKKGIQLGLDFIIHGAYIPRLRWGKLDFLEQLALALYGQEKIKARRKARSTTGNRSNTQIEVLFAPEYNATGDSRRNPHVLKDCIDVVNRNVSDKQRYFDLYRVLEIVWSGLATKDTKKDSSHQQEHGIIVSPELLDIDEDTKKKHLSNLPSDITTILLDCSPKDAAANWDAYQKKSELSFAYSYDYYNRYYPKTNATMHFLKVHREYVRDHNKSQDIILIGGDKDAADRKKKALLTIKDSLILDGYTKIEFINTTSSLPSEVLYQCDDPTKPQKTYRVIYKRRVPHAAMMALNAISGAVSGATGDQSLGEALSALKIIIYECIGHKKRLQEHMITVLKGFTQNDRVQELIDLLFLKDYSQYYHTDYTRLGDLIRDADVFAEMQRITRRLCTERNLVDHFAKITNERLKNKVADSGKPYAIACVMNEIESYLKKSTHKSSELLSCIFVNVDQVIKQNGITMRELDKLIQSAKNLGRKGTKLLPEEQPLIDKLKTAINAEEFLKQEELDVIINILNSNDTNSLDYLLVYTPWLRNEQLRKAVNNSTNILTKIRSSHLVWFAQHSPEFLQYIIQQAERDHTILNALLEAIALMDVDSTQQVFLHIKKFEFISLIQRYTINRSSATRILGRLLLPEILEGKKNIALVKKNYYFLDKIRDLIERRFIKKVDACHLNPKQRANLEVVQELILAKKMTLEIALNISSTQRHIISYPEIRKLVIDKKITLGQCMQELDKDTCQKIVRVCALINADKITFEQAKKLSDRCLKTLSDIAIQELIIKEIVIVKAMQNINDEQRDKLKKIKKLLINKKITVEAAYDLTKDECWKLGVATELILVEKLTVSTAMDLSEKQSLNLQYCSVWQAVQAGIVSIEATENLFPHQVKILGSTQIKELVERENITFTWETALSLTKELFEVLQADQVYKQLVANALSFDFIKHIFDTLPEDKKDQIYLFSSIPIYQLVEAKHIPLDWTEVFHLSEEMILFLVDRTVNSQLIKSEITIESISQRVNGLLEDARKRECLRKLLADGSIQLALDLGGRSIESIACILENTDKLQQLEKLLSDSIISREQLRRWGRPNVERAVRILEEGKEAAEKLRLLTTILANETITRELSNGRLGIDNVLTLLDVDGYRENLQSMEINIENLKRILNRSENLSSNSGGSCSSNSAW